MPSSWKFPSSLVVGEERALTLTDADVHGGLVVSGSRESLSTLHRDGRVALDHRRGAAAFRLDGESERSDIEKEHVLHVTLENTALDGCTDGDHFVGVHTLVRGLAGEFLGRSLRPWACGSCHPQERAR